jgi:GxxExxY protein
MKEQLNAISEAVIGAAVAVHRELGPGLLESAYEACLEFELLDRGFVVERQHPLPVRYRGIEVECGFRLDLRVNGLVILELKAVDRLEKIHEAQLHLLAPHRPAPWPAYQLQRGPACRWP